MFYKLALLLFLLPHLTYGLPCEKSFVKRSKYVSYEEASKYAIANNIRTEGEWRNQTHPAHIPKKPEYTYKKQDKWQGWPVFFGRQPGERYKRSRAPEYSISFEEVKKYAQSIGVKNIQDWQSREHPAYIPKTPHLYFDKRGEWTNWYDFLGKVKKKDVRAKERAARQEAQANKYVSYEEALKYARSIGMKDVKDWLSRKHPPGIPRYPNTVYGRSGDWQGWPVFLGHRSRRISISYEEVQEYARSIGVTDVEDWKSRKHPDHIPKSPGMYFSKRGEWTSWYDFLGKQKKSQLYRDGEIESSRTAEDNKVDKNSDIFILPPLGMSKRRRP